MRKELLTILRWGNQKLNRSVFFIALATYTLPAHAQKLHFLSVINTDNYYRSDRQKDAENINKIANNISKHLNIEKLTYDFSDSLNYNPETVKLTLNSLKVVPCSNDIVWFHYSGNGGNYGENTLPTMRLFGGDLDIKEVERIVASKNPKLLLITVDAPNKAINNEVIANNENYKAIKKRPSALKPTVSFISSKEISHYQTLENYHSLFRDFENPKIIVITSSSKGQDSFSDRLRGSYWVQSFEKTIGEVTSNKATKDIWNENLFVKLSANLNRLSKGMQQPKMYITPFKCEEE